MFGFDNGKKRVFQAGGLHRQGHGGHIEPEVSGVPWLRGHDDLAGKKQRGPH